jgi:hypothetical protein
VDIGHQYCFVSRYHLLYTSAFSSFGLAFVILSMNLEGKDLNGIEHKTVTDCDQVRPLSINGTTIHHVRQQ